MHTWVCSDVFGDWLFVTCASQPHHRRRACAWRERGWTHLQSLPGLDVRHAQIVEAVGTGVQALHQRGAPLVMVIPQSQLATATVSLFTYAIGFEVCMLLCQALDNASYHTQEQ